MLQHRGDKLSERGEERTQLACQRREYHAEVAALRIVAGAEQICCKLPGFLVLLYNGESNGCLPGARQSVDPEDLAGQECCLRAGNSDPVAELVEDLNPGSQNAWLPDIVGVELRVFCTSR